MQAVARPPMASPPSLDRGGGGLSSTPPQPALSPSPYAPSLPVPPLAVPPPVSFSIALDQLPNELLEPIAAYLVPQRLYTSRFALRKTGTWESLDAAVQWASWKTQHDDLLSLVLTSRHLAAIARPYLFYRLVIYDAKTLVGLCRLLHAQPEIGSWISDISCVANLVGERTADEVRLEMDRQFGADLDSSPLAKGDAGDEVLALQVFSRILQDASKLRNLLMALPDQRITGDATTDDPHLTSLMDPIVDYVGGIYTGNALAETPLTRFFPAMDVLSRITSLRLYCHREDGDRERTYDRVFADYIISRLADLTSLRTLEMCCASSGSWLSDDVELPPLPKLERLCLFGSNIHEPALVRLVTACPNLITLLVHFEEACDDLRDRPRLPGGRTFNDALRSLAPTLINLELVTLTEGHFLTRGPERPRKRENHRLTCISELTKLECLTIDYRGLFGTLGIFEHDDGERLLRLLPPSLWCFTLICEWGTPADFKQIYLSNLDMILYGVQCLCAATVPRIRALSLAIQSWPAEDKFRTRFRRQIEEAATGCAKAGIKFRTHDLLPSYRDEDEEDEVSGVEGAEDEDEEDDDTLPQQEDGVILPSQGDAYDELELEEEDEASEYYFSGDEESDPEREARRPASFEDFVERLGDDHGHSFDELYYAWHEDRWDEYIF
ncbi:hypothetical protein GQ53DRAFT_680322, partial [Thozetella sp. PMI_491]